MRNRSTRKKITDCYKKTGKWPKCFHCGVQTERPNPWKPTSHNAFTWQHCLPSRRKPKGNPTEGTKPCCYRCNQNLSRVDDCVAALVCMEMISEYHKIPLER